MNKKSWKLMLAGVVVSGICGLTAWRFAWATPSLGFAGTVVAGPVLMAEIDDKGESELEKIKIKTKGLWESRIMTFSITPGGHTGWHSAGTGLCHDQKGDHDPDPGR